MLTVFVTRIPGDLLFVRRLRSVITDPDPFHLSVVSVNFSILKLVPVLLWHPASSITSMLKAERNLDGTVLANVLFTAVKE